MFDRFFLGMMAANVAQSSHFPTIDAYRPAEVPKQGDDDAETNTLTELGFPDAVEETIPVFTLLPQILPIPPGFSVPVGIQVDQPLPPGRTYHPAFEAWCAAVRHCHDYNSGRPLNTTTANRLFHATFFDDWAELHTVATNDPDSVETSHPLTPIPDHSAPAVAIRDRITAISEASLLHWYQDASLSDQESQFINPTAPQQQATSSSQPSSNEVLLSLAKSLTDAKSSKDHIDSQEFDTLLIKYRILLSYTPDGASLAYAELAPAVKAAFRLRNNVNRANQVREAYTNFIALQEARADSCYHFAHFLEGQIDTPFVNALVAFNWFASPLYLHRLSIDRLLSIFQFLPVDAQNASYTARVATENAVYDEELADEDTTRRTKRSTHLFIHGNQRTINDVIRGANNLLFFLEFLSPDAHKTLLYVGVRNYLQVLYSSTGKHWLAIYESRFPHLAHSLLMEVQDILTPFIAIAKDAPTVTALLQNPDMDMSPVVKALNGAATHARDRKNFLLGAMQSNDNTRYSSPPHTWSWFTPPTVRRPQPSRPDDRQDRRPPAKKTRITPGTGMLVCDQLKLPRCEILFPTTGHEFFHANSVLDIPETHRQRFIDWVTDTPNVSFAPGKGPSPEVCVPSYPLTSQDLSAAAILSSRSDQAPAPPTFPPGQDSKPPASPRSEPVALPMHSKFLPMPYDPHLLPHPPMDLPPSERDRLVMSLDPAVQDAINCKYGKPTTSISFCSEYVFRHVIPHLFASAFLDETSSKLLRTACPLYRVYEELVDEFSPFDPHLARGYSPYVGFRDETEINVPRVRHVSAALIRLGMNVPRLVRWIGGPHLATHRNVPKIISTLRYSVDPQTLQDLERVFTIGSPRLCQAASTEANFLSFMRYGNHASARNNPDKLLQVFVKDAKRGFTLVVDDRLLPFIRDTHLTPIGIVDLDNPWKNDRPVFDSTFRPEPWCFAINDWTDKHNEPALQFPGSFRRLLNWIWNLRISYPSEPILIGDNDICGAFRLVKFNPEVVPMHGYRVGPYLGFATGQTFGDNVSAANFEVCAIARQQHASYLWNHSPDDVLRRAATYVQRMKFPPTPDDSSPFAPANADSQNPGVFFPNGDRKAPPYPHQVDDCMFADIRHYFPLTSAASIVALEDVFGTTHPCQEHVLSMDKLELEYTESRLVVGHVPDSRRMVVELSPRRRSKLIAFLRQEQWLQPRTATLVEIATVVGMIDSAAEFFPWARVQVLVLQDLLRDCIRQEYRRAIKSRTLHAQLQVFHRQLPRSLSDRFDQLRCRKLAEFVWRSQRRVQISRACTTALHVVYDYLVAAHPWEQPIGHIVSRDPAFFATTDASEQAVGVAIPSLALWCFLPVSLPTWTLLKPPRNGRAQLHINTLEFIGIMLGFIMTEAYVLLSTNEYPPSPILSLECDNTAAVSWSRKMSTGSATGRRLLQLFAEYQLLSPLGLVVKHIAGADNTLADLISRPCLPSAKRTRILDSLPPKSRAALAPTLDAVFRCELGATNKTKVLRHFRSMRIHFVWFLSEHELTESVFPVVLLPLETLNYLFACYAAHLGSGHTLSRRAIRSDTIRNYLLAAATLVQLFHPHNLDPRKEKGIQSLCPAIDKVLKEMKRWENIPDRREPYTVAMQVLFCSKVSASEPNCKLSALCDWFSVMLHAGGRRCEWAQPHHISDLTHTPELNVRGTPAAFCLNDITFFRSGKRSLTLDKALTHPHLPTMVTVCFRVQKNGAHGETKLFTQNTHDLTLCPVRHWLSIVQRFVHLVGRDEHIPLAVYYDATLNRVRYLTSTDIERQMRLLAAELYDLDPIRDAKDLARFSAHSLRVGACCVLQALGFEEHEIEKLLRWKSKTWQLYTRNLCVISQKHNKAIFDASTMPQF
ncbi:hypothetical protein IV203_020107 [Nitzschia inconspicua]|uniref:Uncharacterized protein n=1 Tax=Nitzschia inconspicua TaxID=303405 RepID=A0A9K3PBM7_9STRA|nr:hypothetical protein IV203_020476 [Nitzschia inconspicua]KAG7371537.1 hypothetical protein IV203_020107 [Nitzschia inconspicua]